MLDVKSFRTHNSVGDPLWMRMGDAVFDIQERATGTHIVADGAEHLPSNPVILATNASHKFDFFPFRCWLRRNGINAVSLVKGKYFQNGVMARLLCKCAVVPIVSRGYLIAGDFLKVHRRRPSDAEYRALRQHVDADAPLPDDTVFHELTVRSRTIIGIPVGTGRSSYGGAVQAAYRKAMDETIRLTRIALERGHHVHIYPEGTVTGGLGQGRRGALQLAHALGIPILPVGINGTREAFRSPSSARMRGGRIVIRFGELWDGAASELPESFRAFDPEHEREYAGALDRGTAALMARIGRLLDPDYRHPSSNAGGGVARFL